MKKLLTLAALAFAFVSVAFFGATQAQAEGETADSTIQVATPSKSEGETAESTIQVATPSKSEGETAESTIQVAVPSQTNDPIDTYTPHLHKTVVNASGEPIAEWDYTQNPFTFEISSEDGAPLPEETTATTDADGNVAWETVEFTEPGLYTYEITELSGDNANITYDTTVHKLTVNIEAAQPPVVEQ